MKSILIKNYLLEHTGILLKSRILLYLKDGYLLKTDKINLIFYSSITDSPYRETSNIYDGSNRTADMAVQNVIGDSFRGATWVSIHNGGGVGWGEVINGGFGMVIDGSEDSARHIKEMLLWDVNNGIARLSWARNEGAMFAIKREMERTPGLKVTLPNLADDKLVRKAIDEVK